MAIPKLNSFLNETILSPQEQQSFLNETIISRKDQDPQRTGASPITEVMQQVLNAKKTNVQKALDSKWQRYNPVLIGDDLFTIGYLTFQGIQLIKPSLQGIAAIGVATLTCGLIAGAINIGVGIVSLIEAIQALRNGDKILGMRLVLNFVCSIAIGVIMILASLAIQVGFLGGIGAFFAANPWFLPLFFFVLTLPLLLELSYRIKNIATAQDLGSQLKLGALEQHLKADMPNWNKIDDTLHSFNLEELKNRDSKDLPKLLSSKMEKLQADMGVTAAVAIFDLLMQIQKRDKEAAQTKLLLVKEKIEEWNRALYVRMFQQILFFIGFCVSMAALSPKVNANRLNGTQNFCLAGATTIPLYMDSFWPFKRNTPLVVPKMDQLISKTYIKPNK